MTDAGELRERIAWQQRGRDADDRPTIWSDKFSRLAKVTPLRGGEAVIGERLAGSQPYVVRLYADASTRQINGGWRGRVARAGALPLDAILEVKSVTIDEAGKWVDVLVEWAGGAG